MKIIEAWQRDVNDVTWESIFILGKSINPAEYGILPAHKIAAPLKR